MEPAHLRTYIEGTTLAIALKGRSSQEHAGGHTHISGICAEYVRSPGVAELPVTSQERDGKNDRCLNISRGCSDSSSQELCTLSASAVSAV